MKRRGKKRRASSRVGIGHVQRCVSTLSPPYIPALAGSRTCSPHVLSCGMSCGLTVTISLNSTNKKGTALTGSFTAGALGPPPPAWRQGRKNSDSANDKREGRGP